VTSVGGHPRLSERSRESHRKRPVKGDPESDPRLKRGAKSLATLDLRDPSPAQPDEPSKVGEGHAEGAAPIAHDRSKRADQGRRLALTLDDFIRAPDSPDHP
jgi:hypothetical protein